MTFFSSLPASSAFDADKNGFISFSEFVIALSIISFGNLEEKLQLAFKVFDLGIAFIFVILFFAQFGAMGRVD